MAYLAWKYLPIDRGELRVELVCDTQIAYVSEQQVGGDVGRMASSIISAVDHRNPATRAFYLELAGEHPGRFNLEQVATIYRRVQAEWKYVNDPKGEGYFSPASETIASHLTGDCDDFAILLAASVIGIGGEARIALAQAGDTGRAYAEARIASSVEELRFLVSSGTDLSLLVPDGTTGIHQIHYRVDADESVWVNLDWTSEGFGGPYFRHQRLLRIHPADGRIERATGSSEPPAIGRVFAEFSVLTQAFIMETDSFPPNFRAMALEVPTIDPRVVYTEIPNGIHAQSRVAFGDCPAGNVWTYVASRTDGKVRFDLATSSSACRSLISDLPR